jgi:uncharacterized protein YuzB (UPF0349 family)
MYDFEGVCYLLGRYVRRIIEFCQDREREGGQEEDDKIDVKVTVRSIQDGGLQHCLCESNREPIVLVIMPW